MKEKCATRLSVESKWISSRIFFFVGTELSQGSPCRLQLLGTLPGKEKSWKLFSEKGDESWIGLTTGL